MRRMQEGERVLVTPPDVARSGVDPRKTLSPLGLRCTQTIAPRLEGCVGRYTPQKCPTLPCISPNPLNAGFQGPLRQPGCNHRIQFSKGVWSRHERYHGRNLLRGDELHGPFLASRIHNNMHHVVTDTKFFPRILARRR